MMTDPLAKVRPGQPLRIPAAAFNAFIDAAKVVQGFGSDVSRDPTRDQAQSLVQIKNTTLVSIPRFGILGVDAPLFPPDGVSEAFKRRVALKGALPSDTAHFGRFVIAVEPIASQAVGQACGAGLCIARVEFPVDPIGLERERRYADVIDGVTDRLMAGDRGSATIIWREPGSGAGVKWAIVRIGGLTEPALFPVDLTLVGGSDGDALTRASWLYGVQAEGGGAVLAASVDPTAPPHNWTRPEVGGVEFATAGLAHFDGSDALVLDWINETAKPRWSFPILLSQSGGEDASGESSTATWTYNATDAVSGVLIVANIDPTQGVHEWRRPLGRITPATFGYGTLTSAGVFVVGWTNETPALKNSVFPITLTVFVQDPGSATTPANHTYDVRHAITSVFLGAAINPTAAPHVWKRPAVGRMAVATAGLAYFMDPPIQDQPAPLVITWINEVMQTGACPA